MFSGVKHGDYRIGKYEITNGQWNKFKANIAPTQVTGSPSSAYDQNPYGDWGNANFPAHQVSWYEAAQFVNWLNTNTGHHAAYKFTGTQGTSGYTPGVWDAADASGGTNLYRHKNAYYFLPTEDELVKAAYWNGTSLQAWATVGDVTPTQSGWNYYDVYTRLGRFPWYVGSGSAELNGTFDMMGNMAELMEGPYSPGQYLSDAIRMARGGSCGGDLGFLTSTDRSGYCFPNDELGILGFRVASIPEPTSLLLLGLGAMIFQYRKK